MENRKTAEVDSATGMAQNRTMRLLFWPRVIGKSTGLRLVAAVAVLAMGLATSSGVSAQTGGAGFFSGPVITGPDFCLNLSLGGPVTYPFDSNGNGVADVCSLPRTRRAAVARQHALERLGSGQTAVFGQLFAEECRKVTESYGEVNQEPFDECAAPRAAAPGNVPAVPVSTQAGAPGVEAVTFYSGGVITGPDYCLVASLGGPVTYPFDSSGNGVADVCSLPRTRRAAVARQHALERLIQSHAAVFEQLFAEECRKVAETYGEPAVEPSDECAPHRAAGQRYTQLAVGGTHVCGLTEGGLAECVGGNDFGQASPPTGQVFTALAAGVFHTCGLRPDGGVTCWGNNADGQAQAPPVGSLTQVVAGGAHTCALRSDGVAVCWGNNEFGQSTPPAGQIFTSLAAGDVHTCGVRSANGAARCWGFDGDGQADPTTVQAFSQVTTGARHSCGLWVATGGVQCWGYDGDGQSTPPAAGTYTQVVAGGWHTCGLRADGTAVCWGLNEQGQASPPARLSFVQLSAGDGQTCGLSAEGVRTCWGGSVPPSGR